ncbi:NEW3 domain-containing protein [Chloroflexota bacterium]
MGIRRIVCCFCLLMVGILAIFPLSTVLAQEDVTVEEKVELTATYPNLEGTLPGTSFTFTVKLEYQGSEPRYFDLSATGPTDWTISITSAGAMGTRIGGMVLEPGKTYGQEISIAVYPPALSKLKPREYAIIAEASSGEIRDSIELTAVITATYELALAPVSELYNTSTTAGKDNYFPVVVQNTGSATIENIDFSSVKPDGWTIDFSPVKIDSLSTTDFQTVDVNIKPPPKTIAGDYSITFHASGEQATSEVLKIRVTVETPTVWGWVGVGIIALVIGGVVFIFIRFGRR